MINCTFEDGNKASLRHVCVDNLVFNKDGQLLLVKRTAKLIEGGKWGVVGGFVDRDENLMQAAAREIHEETGWEVEGMTLLAIVDRPDRPNDDRQNISFVYFSQATNQTGEPDWESDDVQWYDMDELPARDQIAFDHADHIDMYKKYLDQKPDLPIYG